MFGFYTQDALSSSEFNVNVKISKSTLNNRYQVNVSKGKSAMSSNACDGAQNNEILTIQAITFSVPLYLWLCPESRISDYYMYYYILAS